MKNTFWIIAACLIIMIGCDEPETTPVSTATVTYKPIVSWVDSDVKVPLIYEGDTIKYELNISSNKEVSEYSVYKVLTSNTEEKIKLEGYPRQNFTNKTSITETILCPAGEKAADFKAFKLVVEVKESTGATKSFELDTYSELKTLQTQNGLIVEGFINKGKSILFNVNLSNKKSSFSINQTEIKQGGLLQFTDIGFGSAGTAISGIDTIVFNKNRQIMEISSIVWENVSRGLDIQRYYTLNKNNLKYYVRPNNIKIGNFYIISWKMVETDIEYTFIIKITEIQQIDSNTFSCTFDAKYFNPYKF
jgi:hypothetical protein